jgi:dienelactone hydrolase
MSPTEEPHAMIVEPYYKTASGETLNIEIAPAPVDGKRYPMVVLSHGNFGLFGSFGDQLRDFAEQIAALGYLAALPNFYPDAEPHPTDTDISGKVPILSAAIKHLSDNRSDVDTGRLGLVGFSLGGGVSMSYITDSPPRTVKVFADFYGYVSPLLDAGADVANFPPTTIFHNKNDARFVTPANNSRRLVNELAKATPKIEYEYHEFDELYPKGQNHAFEPGKKADTDSRKLTRDWLKIHMPPTGIP